VLTNNHVVEGMDRVKVSLTDRRTFKSRWATTTKRVSANGLSRLATRSASTSP
jgi:S1-C subfamily serine protease